MNRKKTLIQSQLVPWLKKTGLIWFGILLLTTLGLNMTVYADDGNHHRRLFLSEERVAQLDGSSIKQPILLPDLEGEQSLWLQYYGVFRQDQQVTVLVNQQWISKATKLYGIMVNPKKVSADGLLPVIRSDETIWLAPGQAIRVQDWR